MVATVYALVATSYGLANGIFGNCLRVASLVVTGDLDYYLALPADPMLHVLVSRTQMSSWGDLLSGLAIYVFLVPHSLARLPLFLVYALLGTATFVGFAVLVGSVAFFVNQSQDIVGSLYNALITFSLYPIDIFPYVVRLVLYTMVPAAIIGTLPARLLHEFSIWRLVVLVGFAIGMLALARYVFALGLRRYASGNRVTVRG
jgi:ABC-2 type transport system permease protein